MNIMFADLLYDIILFFLDGFLPFEQILKRFKALLTIALYLKQYYSLWKKLDNVSSQDLE